MRARSPRKERFRNTRSVARYPKHINPPVKPSDIEHQNADQQIDDGTDDGHKACSSKETQNAVEAEFCKNDCAVQPYQALQGLINIPICKEVMPVTEVTEPSGSDPAISVSSSIVAMEVCMMKKLIADARTATSFPSPSPVHHPHSKYQGRFVNTILPALLITLNII